MSSEGSGGFVAGFLFGAFVGAALALVFAPAPGDELREQIKEKSIELKDRAGTLGAEASKRADELVARGQSILQDQRLRFREAVEEGRQAASRRKEELLAQFEGKPGDAALDITEPQV
jgi:gas vesicle protein